MRDRFPSIGDADINKELNKIYAYSLWLGSKYNQELDVDICLSMKKDIVIHLGSIVEGILFYILEVCLSKGLASLDKVESGIKSIHVISPTQRVVIATDKIIKIKPKSLDFCKVIDLIADKGFLDVGMKERLNRIREYRNGIHVSKKILHDTDFKVLDLYEDFMPGYFEVLDGLKETLNTVKATMTRIESQLES